jgi:hypothetical protein
VLPGEQQPLFQPAELAVQRPEVGFQLPEDRVVLLALGQLQKLAEVRDAPLKAFVQFDGLLERAEFAQDLLAIPAALPEVRGVYQGLQLGQALALGGEVKETPLAPGVGRSWPLCGGGFPRPGPLDSPVSGYAPSVCRRL